MLFDFLCRIHRIDTILYFPSTCFSRGMTWYTCDHGSEKGTRWGKIRIWVFGIVSVVIYQNSWCEILWQYLQYFSRYGHFIYRPHYKPCFCFPLIFYSFSWSQQYCILHSQISNFLFVWFRPLIFGMFIHQPIWLNC